MGSILNDIFGSRKSSYGDYRGYNDRQNHKPVFIKRGDNVDSKPSVGDKGSITEKGSNTTPHLLLEARVKLQNTRRFKRIRCEAKIIY